MIKKHYVLNISLPATVTFLLVLASRSAPLPAESKARPSAGLPASLPIPATNLSGNYTDADFARHVEQLKKKLPSKEFSIVIQRPFVVIGDESAETVKQHAEGTVKWAVDKLKQDFFSKDPNEILDIWLFRDAAFRFAIRTVRRGQRPYSRVYELASAGITAGY